MPGGAPRPAQLTAHLSSSLSVRRTHKVKTQKPISPSAVDSSTLLLRRVDGCAKEDEARRATRGGLCFQKRPLAAPVAVSSAAFKRLMASIFTNPLALSALQSLTETRNALNTTEKQISTGFAVSSAADNAAYWSIAAQLNSDSGVVSAANQALAQSQSALSTAASAIGSMVTRALAGTKGTSLKTTVMKTIRSCRT